MTYMSESSTKTTQLWIKAELESRIYTSIKDLQGTRSWHCTCVMESYLSISHFCKMRVHVVKCIYSKQDYTMVWMAHG